MIASQWYIFVLLFNLFSAWLQWKRKRYFLTVINAFAVGFTAASLFYLAKKGGAIWPFL